MIYFYRWGSLVFKSDRLTTCVEHGGLAFPAKWIRTDAFPIHGSFPRAIEAA